MILYSDIDQYCCRWVENLIQAGLLPMGDVWCKDVKEITDAEVENLAKYHQIHWCCGIAGWSIALKLAGWPDDKPVWTLSCPCQPFSVAGRGLGTADHRHLWPHFFRLIRSRHPPVCMGEQVAAAAGYAWLDGVAANLATKDYACEAVDVPACGVGAPHQRNRIYWVANSKHPKWRTQHQEHGDPYRGNGFGGGSTGGGGVANPHREGLSLPQSSPLPGPGRGQERGAVEQHGGTDGGLVYPDDAERGPAQPRGDDIGGETTGRGQGDGDPQEPSGGPWDDWCLVGPDPRGHYRRVGRSLPRLLQLVDGVPGGVAGVCPDHLPLLEKGVPARVSKLRALGNAIVPPLAAEVVRAWMDTHP